MVRVFVVLVYYLFNLTFVYGSSCCGQSSSKNMVLSSKQNKALNITFDSIDVKGRVFSGDDFFVWPEGKKLSRSRLSFDGAYEIYNRHQIFGGFSFVKADYSEDGITESGKNFSDSVIGYSYELVPNDIDSKWKPMVYISTIVNLPTGTSIYDNESLTEGAGVTGHNQYGLGAGINVQKLLYPFNLTLQAKVVRIFDDAEVSGFYDGLVSGVLTYMLPWLDIGVSGGLTQSFLSKRELKRFDLTSDSSKVTTAMLSVQKLINDNVSVSVSASDQSFLGSPQNTLLNKTYSLSLQYNFLN